MKKPLWLSHNILPLKDSPICNGNTASSVAIDPSIYRRWQPQQNTVLLSTQRYRRLLPPIYQHCYHLPILRNLKSKYRFMTLGYFSLFILFLFCSAYFGINSTALTWAIIFLFMSALYLNEYIAGMSRVRAVKERAFFYRWLFSHSLSRYASLFYTTLALSVFLAQIGLGIYYGNEDAVFYSYGTLYDKITQGEYWRLATGAYLHYSILHFLTNLFFVVVIGTLTMALTGPASILVFLAANVAGTYFQYALGAQELQSCAGFSFGVYGLYGFLIGANCFHRPVLPKGFCISLAIVLMTGFIYSEFLTQNAASTGHFAGLLTGLICSIALTLITRYLSWPRSLCHYLPK